MRASKSLTALGCSTLAYAAVMLVLTHCGPTTRPGNGAVFTVHAAQANNGCGISAPSLGAMQTYDLELSVLPGIVKWRIPNAGISATGTHDSRTQEFRLVDDRAVIVRQANARTGVPGCALRRVEVIEGKITGKLPFLDLAAHQGDAMAVDLDVPTAIGDAGVSGLSDGGTSDGGAISQWPGFTAMQTIGWAVIPGGDCTGVLGVGQGQFIALPCQQQYTINSEWLPEREVTP